MSAVVTLTRSLISNSNLHHMQPQSFRIESDREGRIPLEMTKVACGLSSGSDSPPLEPRHGPKSHTLNTHEPSVSWGHTPAGSSTYLTHTVAHSRWVIRWVSVVGEATFVLSPVAKPPVRCKVRVSRVRVGGARTRGPVCPPWCSQRSCHPHSVTPDTRYCRMCTPAPPHDPAPDPTPAPCCHATH
jgi:hypothetical protein